MIHPFDDDREPVLDSFLDEVLGEKSPPDLTARILAAWQRRQAELGTTRSADATHTRPAAVAADVPSAPEGAAGSLDTGTPSLARGNGAARPQNSGPWLCSPRTGESGSSRSLSKSNSKSKPGPAYARDAARWSSGRWAACLAGMLLVGAALGVAALKLLPNSSPDQVVEHVEPPAAVQVPPVAPPSRRATAERSMVVRRSHDAEIEEAPFGHAPPTNGPTLAVQSVVWPAPVADVTLVSFVDQSLAQLWQQHQVQPSHHASDEQWCRRVFIRLLGRIPTVEELAAFTADTATDKHARLVDRLLGEPHYVNEFARNWAAFWTQALIGRTTGTQPMEAVHRGALENFLAQAFRDDVPFRTVAYRLLTASGAGQPVAADFDAAANFLLAVHAPDSVQTTSAVSRVFLGQRSQCFQCHDHPADSGFGQQHFWQLNAFFRQLEVQRDAADGLTRLVNRDAPEDEVFYEQMDGYTRAAYPVLPNGQTLPTSGKLAQVDRRQVLAEWIAGSPQLPRAVVNRVWAHFFGYGFTQPVDDMGPHNPPLHPELFDQLSQQFASHGYSLRKLGRWVALSDAFRRSSEANEHNLADAPERGSLPLFSRYYTRQMQPEAVFDSLRLIAEARQSGKLSSEADRQAWLGQFAPGQSADGAAGSGSVGQSLAVMQSPIMQSAVSSQRGAVLRQVLESDMTPADKLDHLFLAAVARKPNASERQLAEKMLSTTERPQTAYEDIWWALLNSNEFLLDH